MSDNGNEPRKLAIICSKGSLDMAYPPLILANAACMSGIEAHLFFTFWGLDIVTDSKVDGLNVATVGNPNIHPMFHFPTFIGAITGVSSLATSMMRSEIDKLDFPPVREFVEMVMDAGTKVYGCKMSMDMMKLTEDDLIEGAEVLGAMEFLEITADAQILFV